MLSSSHAHSSSHQAKHEASHTLHVSGLLDIDQRGEGFLRPISLALTRDSGDPHFTARQVRDYRLRSGVLIEGVARRGRGPSPVIETLTSVNSLTPERWLSIPEFSSFEVISPYERIQLEGTDDSLTGRLGAQAMRIVDLFCPVGKGQRALIVSPPKAGKTMLLQQMAHAVSWNHPDIELVVLLIDERPEEVTDMRRSIKGQVFASSSDSERGTHVHLAQLVLEYAKRKVETGADVVLLLDSLTRLGRAFNLHQRSSGRTMSGGVDARALEIPKRIFGAARKIEGRGSLTIIATALVETNSRMDDLIFQEFKGTGNMELVLSRDLADERIFPAMNLGLSGTRREELLFGPNVFLHQDLRRAVSRMHPRDAMLTVKQLLERFPTNEVLLNRFNTQ
jgi:transcription termination factor Rho